MPLITKILVALVVLHLIGGFGWLIYKLEFQGKNKSGKKRPVENENED